MRILVIDDDPEERTAFQKLLRTYYPSFTVNYVDNLLDFHELLFETGIHYDRLFIDAELERLPDIDEIEYNQFLKDLQLIENDSDNLHLMGWKYFDQYIRKHNEEIDMDINNILIKTGFAVSIQNSTTPDRLEGVHILNKGDLHYIESLKKFIIG